MTSRKTTKYFLVILICEYKKWTVLYLKCYLSFPSTRPCLSIRAFSAQCTWPPKINPNIDCFFKLTNCGNVDLLLGMHRDAKFDAFLMRNMYGRVMACRRIFALLRTSPVTCRLTAGHFYMSHVTFAKMELLR
jgi:hypothetical protein